MTEPKTPQHAAHPRLVPGSDGLDLIVVECPCGWVSDPTLDDDLVMADWRAHLTAGHCVACGQRLPGSRS